MAITELIIISEWPRFSHTTPSMMILLQDAIFTPPLSLQYMVGLLYSNIVIFSAPTIGTTDSADNATSVAMYRSLNVTSSVKRGLIADPNQHIWNLIT